MRSRSRLHKSKLSEFKSWLESRDWNEEPTKDFYEVLRMKRMGETLLVHRRNDVKEHYTTWGASDRELSVWLRKRA